MLRDALFRVLHFYCTDAKLGRFQIIITGTKVTLRHCTMERESEMLDKCMAAALPFPPNFCPCVSNQARDYLHMGNKERRRKRLQC